MRLGILRERPYVVRGAWMGSQSIPARIITIPRTTQHATHLHDTHHKGDPMPLTHGFELIREETIHELNTVARRYRHAKTGADLLSLQNDDENKVFGITFRTPRDDSTGLPHIMEHSVLCGSRKYPLKEPFIELSQRLAEDLPQRVHLPPTSQPIPLPARTCRTSTIWSMSTWMPSSTRASPASCAGPGRLALRAGRPRRRSALQRHRLQRDEGDLLFAGQLAYATPSY